MSEKIKIKNQVEKLNKEVMRLKNSLKTTREDLKKYKDDPKRKDDLHIYIDKDGEIWLIDAITRRYLLKISFKSYQDILASLTFAHVRYFFFQGSKKTLRTIQRIRSKKK